MTQAAELVEALEIQAAEIGQNPYPGLLYFDHQNSHLFFGREGQTDALIARMAVSRFVAVVGSSGSGKSSLVRAGLLPSLWAGYLRQAGSSWLVADFRPGSDPIKRLATELARLDPFESTTGIAGIEDKLRESSLALVELLRSIDLQGQNLLVLVDQFEELFRFEVGAGDVRGQEERTAFVKLLLEAARTPDLPLYVVITMRSDFLGDCAIFRDLPEAISSGQFLIPRLTRDQQRSAIEGPAHVAGATISNRLVQRLLNDTAEGQDNDQLPLLQHALMRTWDEWSKDPVGPIDLRHYQAIGTLSGALSNHADETFNEAASTVSDGERLVKVAFQRLSGKDEKGRETRRECSIKDLAEVTGRSPDEVLGAIAPFRREKRAFLMPLQYERRLSVSEAPVQELTLDDRVDVTHECLIRKWQVLRDTWLPEEVESAHTYRKLVDRAEDRTPLAGRALTLTTKWWQGHSPNAAWARRYGGDFEKVKSFKERSVRTWRYKAVVITLAIAIALAYGSVITWNLLSAQRKGAIEQALREAEQARRARTVTFMVARTAAKLANEPNSAEAAALLGAAAYLGLERCGGSNEALEAAVRALQSLPASAGRVEHPQTAKIALAGRGHLVAAADKAGTVTLWRVPELSLIGKVGATDEEPKHLELSADGTRLAIGTENRMRIFRLTLSGSFSSELELNAPCPNETWISLSRGGEDAIATCGGGSTVAYWYRWSQVHGWKQLEGARKGMGWVPNATGTSASYIQMTGEWKSLDYHIVSRKREQLLVKPYVLPFTLAQWDVARADLRQMIWQSGLKTIDFVTSRDHLDGDVQLIAADEIATFSLGDKGEIAVAATLDGLVQLWTLEDGMERLRLRFDEPVTDLALDEASGYLAIALENEVRLLGLSLAQRFVPGGMSASEVASVAPSTLPMLKLRAGDATPIGGDFLEGCRQRALAANGRSLAYTDCGRLLVLGEVGGNAPIKATKSAFQGRPRRLMISGDGSRMAVATVDVMPVISQKSRLGGFAAQGWAVHLFEVEGQALVERRVEAAPEHSTLWEFARSGATVWTVSGDETALVRRLNFEKGPWQTVVSLNGRATALAVSPKEDWLALAVLTPSKDASKPAASSLRVWKISGPAPLELELRGPQDTLDTTTSIAFASDSAHLATADGSTVRLWSLDKGSERARVTLPAPVTSISFAPDGQVIAVSGGHAISIPWEDEALRHAVCRAVDLDLATVWKKYVPDEKQPKQVCDPPVRP